MVKSDDKDQRMREIEEAAYALLSETGAKATSLLAVAKRAKASNETLYRWYGNKQGLFLHMVERNAGAAIGALQAALDTEKPLAELLDELGPIILRLVVGERAVVLNRAAAGDVHDGGSIGKLIADGGRDKVEGLLCEVFSRRANATLTGELIASTYLDVLIGDLQVKRIIGAMDILDDGEIGMRSEWAKHVCLRLAAQAEPPRPSRIASATRAAGRGDHSPS